MYSCDLQDVARLRIGDGVDMRSHLPSPAWVLLSQSGIQLSCRSLPGISRVRRSLVWARSDTLANGMDRTSSSLLHANITI